MGEAQRFWHDTPRLCGRADTAARRAGKLAEAGGAAAVAAAEAGAAERLVAMLRTGGPVRPSGSNARRCLPLSCRGAG